jgi:hypothetical protein
VQNNRASAHVLARGQRRILILENQEGDCKFLAEVLLAAGKAKFQLVVKPVGFLGAYKDRDKLAVLLSNFDCVVLANVAADQLSEEQQEVIRSNTHDQGWSAGRRPTGPAAGRTRRWRRRCRWTARSSR